MNKKTNEKMTAGKGPRKANECLIERGRFYMPLEEFDKFWHTGELALFFGAAGAGKSVLAMQLAEALARGRNLEGFRMPIGRKKVLYVDLELRDEQFQARYSYVASVGMSPISHKFAENLYRDRPHGDEDLCDWLRAMVKENWFHTVIVDSLSAVQRTHDGTRDTLAVARRLKQISDELCISILVLADSAEPGRSGMVSEADLRRSRVLCNVADSVFAIGVHPRQPGNRYLIQTRSRSAPVFWTEQNAPVCSLTRTETGMLSFDFDERFAPYIDKETRRLICEVRSMREGGASFRQIAKELGISKNRASTLEKKWTPAMDCGTRNAECGVGNEEEVRSAECGVRNEEEVRSAECGVRNEEEVQSAECGVRNEGEMRSSHSIDVLAIPWAAGLGRRTVYALKPGFDGYGRVIYIESEDESTGKPRVWYQFDRSGNNIRHERKTFSIITERLGESPYL